ncbi:MAG: NAD(P)-binding protein [Acidobacteriota bacterium]
MSEGERREKVVIVGGGVAAMAAAFELTDPAQKDRYDVTVYQMGWRLGGKGASGRNMERNARIEEHGLHVWFGCYDNAFNVMARCYEELGRPQGAPLATLDDAFKGKDQCVFQERVNGEWVPWVQPFPSNEEEPGSFPTVWEYVVHLFDWMVMAAHGFPVTHEPLDDDESAALHHEHHWWSKLLDDEHGPHPLHEEVHSPLTLLEQARHLAKKLGTDPTHHKAKHHRFLTFLLGLACKAVWRLCRHRVETESTARHYWIYFMLATTSVRGILADGLTFHGFDGADDEELRAWFFRHSGVKSRRANDLGFWSPPMQALYDASFAYARGDAQTPSLAAGTALRIALRLLLGYKGHMVWEMQAGMGDTIFAPLYEVLKRRGVAFEFFHRVRKLELDDSKTEIARLRVSRQVDLACDAYEPLVDVKGLPCWPNRPLFDQIEDGAALEATGANLEHYDYGADWQDRGEITLEAGRDFDWVVLGVTHACLPPLCGELEVSDNWRAMIHGIDSVQTQAIQLWLEPDSRQLGWEYSPVVIGSYVEPYSSIADFTHLLKRESWPADAVPGNLTYSCGVLEEQEGETQQSADQRAEEIAVDYLNHHVAPVFPKGVRADNPDGLDWSKLVASPALEGEERLQDQYLRANFDPTERYVLSVPGTQRVRIKAGETGFGRLVITGTWIDTGLNISAVETAAMAGRQASRAISGIPKTVPGEKDL